MELAILKYIQALGYSYIFKYVFAIIMSRQLFSSAAPNKFKPSTFSHYLNTNLSIFMP